MISRSDWLVGLDLLCLPRYCVHGERINLTPKRMQSIFLPEQRCLIVQKFGMRCNDAPKVIITVGLKPLLKNHVRVVSAF